MQSEGKVRERERKRERERERERERWGRWGWALSCSTVTPTIPQGLAKPLHPLFYGSSDVLSFTPTIPMGFAKPLHPPFSCSGTVLAGYQALTRLSARLSITCQSVLDFFLYQVGRDMRQY
jgi:hypothetical protein